MEVRGARPPPFGYAARARILQDLAPLGETMTDYVDFQKLSPTTLADVLTRDRIMDIGIRPLWPGMPRVAGPAYPVRCAPGDNLMVHAAIHRAFVVDGVIRDLAEVRENRFAVFARGVIPIPGAKEVIDVLNGPVRCGGVEVAPGDVVVADEEGIVVVPVSRRDTVLERAQARAAKDAAETLEAWEAAHRARIEEILRKKGFAG
jgi:4-hydroxy-4-methyl-2-oxoglutarate aldolase